MRQYYVTMAAWLLVALVIGAIHTMSVYGKTQAQPLLKKTAPVQQQKTKGAFQSPASKKITKKSGLLLWSETWSGTVQVTGDVIVSPFATLTIAPGTQVLFAAQTDDRNSGGSKDDAEYSIFPNDPPLVRNNLIAITVLGTLRAVGTPGQPILFTSDATTPTNHDWETIRIEGRGMIEYAVLEHAYLGISVAARSGPVTIRHNVIQDIAACALCTGEGTRFKNLVTVTDNVIQGAGHEGLDAYRDQQWKVERNVFTNNVVGLVCNGCKMTASKNSFTNNERGMITINGGVLTAHLNRITGNTQEAVETFNPGSTLILRQNNIVGNAAVANLGPGTTLDAQENWLGTTRADDVLQHIVRADGANVSIAPLLERDPLSP